MLNIYVGNLPFSVTDDELRERFEAHGEVDKAFVIQDRESNRSRGFGFVEMANNSEGDAAIEAENEADWDGRKLTVNKAKPREDRPRGGSGGGRGGNPYDGNR